MPRATPLRAAPASPRTALRRDPHDEPDIGPLPPACIAYLDAMLGPVMALHPWLTRLPTSDHVSAALMRCRHEGDLALADAFERALPARSRVIVNCGLALAALASGTPDPPSPEVLR